ncbi:MAG: Hsp70 family protein [Myxococcota bacterium]
MGKAIGIDLGTTNACVAVVEDGEAVVLPNREGVRTTPCMVTFTESGERLIGQMAKRQALTNPLNTISNYKGYIGRNVSIDLLGEIPSGSYRVVTGENGEAGVWARDRSYSIAEVTAMVIHEMMELAEDYLLEEVTQAVITVPAYFDAPQRQATLDAGRIAGLEDLQLIDEPVAAGLAYGLQRRRNAHLAVYALGGATLEISILKVDKGKIEVLGSHAERDLGGRQIDREIIDRLAESFATEHPGVDLRQDRMAHQRLTEAAEAAKRQLSYATSTEVNLPFIMADRSGPEHLNLSLSRGELERMVDPLIRRTRTPCQRALEAAGVDASHIDEVLLVGGQTHMPRVQRGVEGLFGLKPRSTLAPEEVAAMGAAMQAAQLSASTRGFSLAASCPDAVIDREKQANMDSPKSTLETTRDNLAYAARVAGAQVLLDKLVDITLEQLRSSGVDTRMADSPIGRSLLKIALPTVILAASNSELLGSSVSPKTLNTVRGLAELSQLAATVEGATVLAQLARPLFAELVSVRGALPPSTLRELDELLVTDEAADPVSVPLGTSP